MLNLTKRWPLGLTRQNWPNVATSAGIVLFIAVFIDVWASQSMQAWPEVWKAPFAFITDFGLSDWVLIPSLAILLLAALATFVVPKGLHRRATYELALISGFIFVGVGLPGLFTNLAKRLVGRARPVEFADYGAFHFQHIFNHWDFQSFPSGHSATALGTAFVVGFMLPRFFPFLLLLALATGVSRVVIGMHYPTDVIAGFLVGMFGAYAVRNFFASRRWLFVRRPDGTVQYRGVPNLRRAIGKLFHRARA